MKTISLNRYQKELLDNIKYNSSDFIQEQDIDMETKKRLIEEATNAWIEQWIFCIQSKLDSILSEIKSHSERYEKVKKILE